MGETGDWRPGGRLTQSGKDELDAEMRGLQETPACPLQRPRSLLGKRARCSAVVIMWNWAGPLSSGVGPLVCGVCGKVCAFYHSESKSCLPSGSGGSGGFSSYFAPQPVSQRCQGPAGHSLSQGLRHLSASSPLSPAEPFLSGYPLPPANIAANRFACHCWPFSLLGVGWGGLSLFCLLSVVLAGL